MCASPRLRPLPIAAYLFSPADALMNEFSPVGIFMMVSIQFRYRPRFSPDPDSRCPKKKGFDVHRRLYVFLAIVASPFR